MGDVLEMPKPSAYIQLGELRLMRAHIASWQKLGLLVRIWVLGSFSPFEMYFTSDADAANLVTFLDREFA